MRILLSAFVCAPDAGSEEGLGWSWATALAAEHDVTVLADASQQPLLDAALAADGAPALRPIYVGTGVEHRFPFGVYGYYTAWQHQALEVARALHREQRFDVAHHVTYASMRIPSQLHHLDIPFIWGPVGGGEEVPLAFADPRWLGVKGAASEVLRWTWNRAVTIDPRLRATVRGSRLSVFSTRQSEALLSSAGQTTVMNQARLAAEDLAVLTARRASPPPVTGMRVAFAGRLFGWKGSLLALHAFARYAASMPDAHLEIYGDGPLRPRVEAAIADLGVEDRVTLHGMVDRTALLASYADHHAFLFPSLHDSGGFVVQEAMAAGLPVLCLQAGGPGDAVPPGAGVVVEPTTPTAAVAALADGLLALTSDPSRWQAAADTAVARATDPEANPSWPEMVRRLYTSAGLIA